MNTVLEMDALVVNKYLLFVTILYAEKQEHKYVIGIKSNSKK